VAYALLFVIVDLGVLVWQNQRASREESSYGFEDCLPRL
jgi:hypothetical protein